MIIKNLNRNWALMGLLVAGLSACGETEKTEQEEKPQEAPVVEEVECNCPAELDPDGELMQGCYTFSNGQTALVCGWAEEEIISEFVVVNQGGDAISNQYDAMQVCKVNFSSDTLEIIELKNLPISMSGNRELIPIGKEIIVDKGGELTSMGMQPNFSSPEISEEEQAQFLDGLDFANNGQIEWHDVIAKLEVLALMGNQKAKEVLFDLEILSGEQFDGAVSEDYGAAIANVNWVER